MTILDGTFPVVYIQFALSERGYAMTILYEQFLGSEPGICVELVDNSKSPYRVRTLDGFEFHVSAEDFRRFYRERSSPVPDAWRPFVTDQTKGLVDANKMAKVMEALQPFEKVFRNFSRARYFVRDFITLTQHGDGIKDDSLKNLMEKYSGSYICLDDLKHELDRLKTLDRGIRTLLTDESCLNSATVIGQIGKPFIRPTDEGTETQHAVNAASEKPQVTQPILSRGNMKNVDMKVEGDLLTITIDLSRDFGPSKSGKTIIIASTEGNKSVPGKEHKIGLNVYKYTEDKGQCGNSKSFKNTELQVTESILTIIINLSKEFGPSKSGKTIIVASTEGNQLIYGRNERIGLNVYRRLD